MNKVTSNVPNLPLPTLPLPPRKAGSFSDILFGKQPESSRSACTSVPPGSDGSSLPAVSDRAAAQTLPQAAKDAFSALTVNQPQAPRIQLRVPAVDVPNPQLPRDVSRVPADAVMQPVERLPGETVPIRIGPEQPVATKFSAAIDRVLRDVGNVGTPSTAPAVPSNIAPQPGGYEFGFETGVSLVDRVSIGAAAGSLAGSQSGTGGPKSAGSWQRIDGGRTATAGPMVGKAAPVGDSLPDVPDAEPSPDGTGAISIGSFLTDNKSAPGNPTIPPIEIPPDQDVAPQQWIPNTHPSGVDVVAYSDDRSQVAPEALPLAELAPGVGPTRSAVPMSNESSTALIEPFAPAAGILTGEVTWARIYSEHLVSNGYLSVIDQTALGADAPAEQAEPDDRVVVVSPKRVADAIAEHVDGELETVANETVGMSSPLIAERDETGAEHVERDVESQAQVLAPSMLTNESWAQRLIRLTQDQNGLNTVWLRDYTLKEADLEPVADRLRQSAQDGSITVDRVVINGRVAWRASTFKSEP